MTEALMEWQWLFVLIILLEGLLAFCLLKAFFRLQCLIRDFLANRWDWLEALKLSSKQIHVVNKNLAHAEPTMGRVVNQFLGGAQSKWVLLQILKQLAKN